MIHFSYTQRWTEGCAHNHLTQIDVCLLCRRERRTWGETQLELRVICNMQPIVTSASKEVCQAWECHSSVYPSTKKAEDLHSTERLCQTKIVWYTCAHPSFQTGNCNRGFQGTIASHPFSCLYFILFFFPFVDVAMHEPVVQSRQTGEARERRIWEKYVNGLVEHNLKQRGLAGQAAAESKTCERGRIEGKSFPSYWRPT